MNKPKLTLSLYALAGVLWLIVAIRNLLYAADTWQIAMSVFTSFCFLALAVAQAKRLRQS